jgi:hypothetical protein
VALTSLQLQFSISDIPASISQLTALQQLDVSVAQYTSLLTLHVLQGLTQLRVQKVAGMSIDSAHLPLPALQHLDLVARGGTRMPMQLLSSCQGLQDVSLSKFAFKGPGPLIGSSKLQRLVLDQCGVPFSDWQQVFPANPAAPQSDNPADARCCARHKDGSDGGHRGVLQQPSGQCCR